MIRAFRTAVFVVTASLALHNSYSAADFDEKTIKDASVEDIRKWITVDEHDHYLYWQWKILSNRSEPLSWWIKIIGFQPLFIRNQRAAWDPRANRGRYILDDGKRAGGTEHLFFLIADMPTNHSDTTPLRIDLINVDELDK